MRSIGKRIAAVAVAAGLVGAGTVAVRADAATPATLRAAAAAAGIRVGAAVSAGALGSSAAALAAREFDSLTPENEMKWSAVSPAPGVFDFAAADALVAFAEANDMRVRGHTLAWGRPNGPPAWLEADLAAAADPAARLLARMTEQIDTQVRHFAGQIESWDVVNEPLALFSGELEPGSPYTQLLGESFIGEAFRLAHAADPGAKLFLNEIGAERLPEKFSSLVSLTQRLLDAAVPIDGVGFQGHFLKRPDRALLEKQLRTFADLGLRVEITELDLPIVIFQRDADPFGAQARAYADVFGACLAVSGCTGVTTWGITDADSWLDDADFYRNFAPNLPLLFDVDGNAKPAHAAVLATLAQVPEPGAGVLLSFGLALLARRSTPARAGVRSGI